MGRLWLTICAVLLCSTVVLAGYVTSKKDLERAAELAVERAAEKAAERAVEKSLNSGNSSTITVTVKEAYKNIKKTAEEAAAPGSESTRFNDNPQMYDRQYAYQPPADGEYKVSESAEARELGVPQESLNSSVEDLGSAEVTEGSAEGEAEGEALDEPVELTSFESVKESADITTESTPKDFDVSLGLDFGLDFGSLDMSGDFGLKGSSSRKTKTYTTSYSEPKDSDSSVDVSDDEDAEVLGMYNSDFGETGWSSAKEKGWVRHRPLWDDNKSRVSRGSLWDDLKMESNESDEKRREKKSSDKSKPKLFKRNAGDYEAAESTNQVAVPLASLSLDPKAPALLYQLLQKELKYSTNNYSMKSPMPMRLYVTVPVPYLRANKQQNDEEVTHITPRPYKPAIAPKDINDEIDDQRTAATKRQAKRSNDFGRRTYLSIANKSKFPNNHQLQSGRQHRSLAKVTKHKFELKSSTTQPILDIVRIKPKS